jgi:hypothetical protein
MPGLGLRSRASPRLAEPPSTPCQLEDLPPELLTHIVSTLSFTDAACLALTSGIWHGHVALAFRECRSGCHGDFEHLLCALATRMRPTEFADHLEGIVFEDDCSCHFRVIGRAAVCCPSRDEWSPRLLSVLGGCTEFAFDAKDVKALMRSCDYDKLVRFAIIALWVTSHFSFRSSTRESIQLLLRATWSTASSSGLAVPNGDESGFASVSAGEIDEAVAEAVDRGVDEGWLVESLSADESGEEEIVYELHHEDNDVESLHFEATQWRELAGPLVSAGRLTHSDVLHYILPRFSMTVQVNTYAANDCERPHQQRCAELAPRAAPTRPSHPPAQRAVFAVEYFFALEAIDAHGARELASALARMKSDGEADPSRTVGSHISELAWWTLEWLQHMAHGDKPVHMLTVQWAETLVAFVETYTLATGGDLPYFGAHEGMVWLESETARVVLALDDAPPAYVAPQWLLLSDMCALTCKFGTRRGFASSLGRCAAAGAVSDIAVLKIVALYVDTAAEIDRSPAPPRSTHNLATRVATNGVAFLSAWAEASHFPSRASSEKRIRVADSIRMLCGRLPLFKTAVAGFVRKWKAELELQMGGSEGCDFFDLGMLCGGATEPAPAAIIDVPPIASAPAHPHHHAAILPTAGLGEPAVAEASRPEHCTVNRPDSQGNSCCVQ